MSRKLRTIGLLGGMGWPSTGEYYSLLNKGIEMRLGNHRSVNCIVYSFDFDLINPNYRSEQEIVYQFEKGIKLLQLASAELLLFCSNTAHRYLDMFRENYDPKLFLDIRDCTGLYIKKKQSKKCLLLGTRFTMSEGFYKEFLADKYGIEVMVPADHDQLIIHNYIFQELANNIVSKESVTYFYSLSKTVAVDAIILGCTELGLIFKQFNCEKVIIDTTAIHVDAAIEFIVGPE